MAFVARESAILGYQGEAQYNGALCLRRAPIAASWARQVSEYDIRPGNGLLLTSAFSGGNQQKIVLARELDRNPDLLLVGQPTRGVDIGAIEFIHQRLVALRDAGRACWSSRSSSTRSWRWPIASWSCTTDGSSGRWPRPKRPSGRSAS